MLRLPAEAVNVSGSEMDRPERPRTVQSGRREPHRPAPEAEAEPAVGARGGDHRDQQLAATEQAERQEFGFEEGFAKARSGPPQVIHRAVGRFEVPVEAGAVAREGDRDDSRWGVESTLQIGDEAETFALPRADGTEFLLDDLLYQHNVLVTTYRAFW